MNLYRVFCYAFSIFILFFSAVLFGNDRRISQKNKDFRVISPAVEASVQSQEILRGTVTDEGGNVLSGVIISIKGSATGNITDSRGAFRITAPMGSVLVFRMTGFKSREIMVEQRSFLRVELHENINKLNEVVINTGYQTVNRRKFTGAATTINALDAARAGVPDLSRMLEGQAAGVSVQNVSGTFGAAPKIRIRGATSITGNNKPLWVVDGIILEDIINISNDQLSTGDPSTLLGSSVANLNPDDIATFQILKDAAATSLYGARAMNGVIVVSTKKGRTGAAPSVSYTGTFTTFLKPGYQQFDIINSYDQMSVYAEMERKGWLNYTTMANVPTGGVYTKLAQALSWTNNGTTNPAVENTVTGRRAFLQKYVNVNTDWFDVLFRNSLQQEHAIGISSGTEKSQLYYSTSYLQDNGWSLGSGVKRYTAHIRGDFKLSDRLSLGLITTGSVRDQQSPGTIAQRSDPVTGTVSRDFDINPFNYALQTTRTMTSYQQDGSLEYFTMNYAPFNIINELRNNTTEINVTDIKVQGELKYQLPEHINYNFLGAYRFVHSGQEHKVRENSNMAMAYRAGTASSGMPENNMIAAANRFLYVNPDDPAGRPVTVLPYGGFYNTNDDDLKSYYLRNSLDWSAELGAGHSLRTFVSQELRFLDRISKGFTGYGYQYDRGGTPFVDPRAIQKETGGSQSYYAMQTFRDRYVAFAGNVAYSYNGKYQFNSTLRYDGSNQMGESSTARWLPTWNFSGSWNIDQESFMQSQEFFDALTLRATYGLTASMGNATNSSLIVRSGNTTRPYLYDVEPVLNIINNPNRDLTWEKQYETNIGLDMSLLKGRFQVSMDVYNRNGFDLIGQIRSSGIGGEALKFANYADMNVKGAELLLRADVFRRAKWGWKMQLSNAFNRSRITRLSSEPLIWDLVTSIGGAKQGYPQRALFSIDFEKLNAERGTPIYVNEGGIMSDNVYLQSIQTQYLKYEGPVDPTFTGGWYNAFHYRNFTASVLLTYALGNKVRLNPIFKNAYSDAEAMSYDFLNRFVIPNDYNVPSIAESRNASALAGNQVYNAYNYSDARVADGGFVRLKQITLGYNFPKPFGSSIGLQNLSLTLAANNLSLLYADDRLHGQDPEFYGAGGVALPLPRQFTLSLKTNL